MSNRTRIAHVPMLVPDAALGLERATTLPHAMALGATREPDYAYRAGSITGVEARALGGDGIDLEQAAPSLPAGPPSSATPRGQR